MSRLFPPIAVMLAVAGCELAETTLPPGDDVLAVEAVLRAGSARQRILLHRSLDGRAIRPETGAIVAITTEGGLNIRYEEAALSACLGSHPADWEIEDLEVDPTCYLSPTGAGYFVQPGATYELSIETANGRMIRGRTTVPGGFGFEVPAIPLDPVTLDAACTLPDSTFTLVWRKSAEAWSYLLGLRLTDWGEDLRRQGVEVPDPLNLTGVSVSASDTTLVFPSNLGLFQRADLDQRLLLALQDGIPAGARATLVVLAADQNYTNAIRGGRFNPSGNVRGSSVVGDAVGVFGSVVPATIDSSMPSTQTSCPIPVD